MSFKSVEPNEWPYTFFVRFYLYLLSGQCKEIEENNRMGKTRDLFKKMRYQGNISCKDGHKNGQKWYGPNRHRRYSEEVARIHRRIIQKDLNDPDNHDGVITHIEPDIMECEVKWALRTKLVEVLEFQLSSFKS